MDLSFVFDFLLLQRKDWSLSIRSFPSFHIEHYNLTDIKELKMININEGNIDWDNYDFKYRQGILNISLSVLGQVGL